MVKRNLKLRKIWTWAIAPALLMFEACQHDLEVKQTGTQDQIAFNVVYRTAMEQISRSGVASEEKVVGNELLMVSGTDSIMLSITEEKNDNPLFFPDETTTASMTRGAAYTTATMNQFQVTALVNGTQTYFTESLAVSGGNANSERYWPLSAPLDFFAYAISQEGTTIQPTFVGGDNCSGRFSYALPKATGEGQNKEDAVVQPDVIFAIASKPTPKEAVPLTFHHALSAIVFKVKTLPKNVTLSSVEFVNLYTEGNCTVTPSGTNDLAFTWDFTGKTANGSFKQAFNKVLENPVNGVDLSTNEQTFLMLPQNFSNDAAIVITFKIAGGGIDERTYTVTKKMQEIHATSPKWEADKRYTYTISVPEEVLVEVDDDVTGNVKSGISIQNTGLATAYIRASIMAYWVNENGVIIAPCKASDGEYNWGEHDQHWITGTDGFYYHKTPVAQGEFTGELFESYTLKAEPPLIGAKLVFNILAQAVIASGIGNAWPTEIVSTLNVQP